MGRKLRNGIARALLYGSTLLICALLLTIVGIICVRGVPYLTLPLLTSEESILHDTVGILPAILNTEVVILSPLRLPCPSVSVRRCI